MSRFRQFIAAAAVLLLATPAAVADEALRIGVLAYRGKERAAADWQPHADYLAQELSRRVAILPLGYAEINAAVRDGGIDLLITNTGHYTELETGGRVSRIATRLIAGPEGPLTRFGGTAIRLATRGDIRLYRDLKGKTVLIPDRSSLGGWQVHVREAQSQGLSLTRDVSLRETGNHEKVVQGILAGEADAGFIRSDLIESMVAAGKLAPGALAVIDARDTPGYPFAHSTRLYPEWPLARLESVSEPLARDILTALLRLRPEHPAARAAGIAGWTLPHNYQSVLDLFIETRLGPYANLPVTASDLMARYGVAIVSSATGLIVLLLLALVVIARGNRHLKRSQAELRLAAGVFEHAQEGIVITDPRAIVLDVNDTFLALTGYAREEIIGQNPRILSSGRQDASFYGAMWETLQATGNWRGDIWNRRKNGEIYAQRTSISGVRNRRGEITHYIGLSYDITSLLESQEQLQHMAYFDALTGLPNRRLLADRLQQAIALANRSERLLAVCYIDLDGFKPINDTWGHAAGDRLLVEAAGRLNGAIRGEDTVSRLGGDEFVVLIGGLANIEESESAVDRIRTLLSHTYRLTEGDAQISASIGMTLYPLDASDPDTLIRHADQAMYAAKQGGRNRYQVFDAGGDRLSDARREALATIHAAIDGDQFVLHYQPKVSMRTGEVIGAEALIRWQHPERGLLYPGDFLAVVDFVGEQTALGDWVLRKAIRQIAAWNAAGLRLAVSINVAAEQLQHADFIGKLRATLAEHPDVTPDQVELELLETAALHDLIEVAGTIARCHEFGIRFAIDDFGTGYSSLTYLKQLQAHTLKIDQTFVRDMLEDPEDLAIVDGIISLAGAFRRQVVAEGVETIAHGRLLRQLGCELAQGYAIARPLAPDAFVAWMGGWRQPAEWRDAETWPREDLPLLTMAIEHQRWYADFVAALRADGGDATVQHALPQLDPHQCRFGRWIDSTGRRRFGHLAAFADLERQHEEVHLTGHRLAEQYRTDPEGALAGLDALAASRDDVLAALDELRVMAASHR